MCFNTQDWVVPSGRTGKSPSQNSFENLYGFGFEEWNLSNRHIIDGYKYMYLEGLRFYTPNRHDGHDLILYTRTRGSNCTVISVIGRVGNSDWSFINFHECEKILNDDITNLMREDLQRNFIFTGDVDGRIRGFNNQRECIPHTPSIKLQPSVFNLKVTESSFEELLDNYQQNGLNQLFPEIDLNNCKRYQLYVR